MKRKITTTGQYAPDSGQYRVDGTNIEITLVRGTKVPPTRNGNTKFILIDKTKHKK